MRMGTIMSLGIRNVGDRADEGTVWTGPMNELIEKTIRWLGKETVKKRIEIIIAPDVVYVENRIMGTKITKALDDEESLEAVRRVMEGIDSGEALESQGEDDYYEG